VDTETGDYGEQRLEHSEGAEKFYRDLAAQGKKVRVGMEASGHARWFERLVAELTFELWIGDASEIRARRVRKQKTDRQDAQHIPQLLVMPFTVIGRPPEGGVRHYCRLVAPVGKTSRPVRRIVVTSYSNAVPQRRQT
jgi:hypothetical protein